MADMPKVIYAYRPRKTWTSTRVFESQDEYLRADTCVSKERLEKLIKEWVNDANEREKASMGCPFDILQGKLEGSAYSIQQCIERLREVMK